MTTVVIMPGGFHPLHAGHMALYNSAKRAFPDAEVFVAATNDTSSRPFPFAVKEKLAKLAGVEAGHFVQVKSPFRAEEITSRFDPQRDVLIFVRSEKDAGSQPQPGGVKKDGSPSYLQPLLGARKLEPFSKHAYMAYLPTVEFGPGMTSATQIRTAWPTLNDRRKTALVMSLYPATQKNPKLAQTVVRLLDAAIGTESVAEASGGVSVRKWAAQVRKDHGADVKFRNRQEGGGAVDSVIAKNSNGETVGVYNRKTGYPTVYEPKQAVAEASLEDRLKKYVRPVVKTTPKIERTTNPAGRTTDHVEWKVTGPMGDVTRFSSKKAAQAHYDSFGKPDTGSLNEFAPGAGDDEENPLDDYPCYDCGSTIYMHHTRLCDLAEPDAVRDLPAQPGTQYWTGRVPKGLTPIPGLNKGVAEGGIATVGWPDEGNHTGNMPPVRIGGTFPARPVVKKGSLVKAIGISGVYRVMDIRGDQAYIVQEIPNSGGSNYVPMSDLRVWTNKPVVREQGVAEGSLNEFAEKPEDGPGSDDYEDLLFHLAYEIWEDEGQADQAKRKLSLLGWTPEPGDDYTAIVLYKISGNDHRQYTIDEFEEYGQQGVAEGSQEINWVKPNFNFEWHEVEEQSRMKQVPVDVRQYYQKHFPNKDAWLKAVQNGKAVVVPPDHAYEIRNAPFDKASLQKVLAPTGHEGPIGPAKEKRVNDLFDKGQVEMPIILKTSQGLWLIGGKTRLGTANYVKGLPAKVWLIGGEQGMAEGVELMTDAQFYGEILSVLAALGAGLATGAYLKVKDIVKMYNANQIMRALEGHRVSNISDAERRALTKLLAEFKQAMANRQGEDALAIANRIKSIATDQSGVAETVSASHTTANTSGAGAGMTASYQRRDNQPVDEGWKDVVAGSAMALGALGVSAQSMPNINAQQVELTNKYYKVLVQRAVEDGRTLDARTKNFLMAKAQDAAAQKIQKSTAQSPTTQAKPQFPSQGSEQRRAKDFDQFESQDYLSERRL